MHKLQGFTENWRTDLWFSYRTGQRYAQSKRLLLADIPARVHFWNSHPYKSLFTKRELLVQKILNISTCKKAGSVDHIMSQSSVFFFNTLLYFLQYGGPWDTLFWSIWNAAWMTWTPITKHTEECWKYSRSKNAPTARKQPWPRSRQFPITVCSVITSLSQGKWLRLWKHRRPLHRMTGATAPFVHCILTAPSLRPDQR